MVVCVLPLHSCPAGSPAVRVRAKQVTDWQKNLKTLKAVTSGLHTLYVKAHPAHRKKYPNLAATLKKQMAQMLDCDVPEHILKKIRDLLATLEG